MLARAYLSRNTLNIHLVYTAKCGQSIPWFSRQARPVTRSAFTALFSGVQIAPSDPASVCMSASALRTFPHDLCSSSKLYDPCGCASVEGGVTLIEPFALHGFLKRSHHEVGFLHEFVDQMGMFPWFHA